MIDELMIDDTPCLFLKKVDSIFTFKINNSISVRNLLTLLPAELTCFPEKVDFGRILLIFISIG